MFKASPGALPWHAVISKGAITINDNLSGSAGYKSGPPPVRTLSMGASRAWQGDWTFTPVIDPNILSNLCIIYKEAAEADWVHTNASPANNGGFSGHYKTTFVWVEKKDLDELVNTTMKVLGAVTSVTTPLIGFTGSGLRTFVNDLQASATNADMTSQFLLAQLPGAVRTIITSTNSNLWKSDTIPWIKEVLESGLNKTMAGWTTNEVAQLATTMQMSRPGSLPTDLKCKLSEPLQSNALLRLSISLLKGYYPNAFAEKEAVFSVPMQNSLFFSPGPTIMVPH
jgi:hypothetical protein